jgi:hypothetical protein
MVVFRFSGGRDIRMIGVILRVGTNHRTWYEWFWKSYEFMPQLAKHDKWFGELWRKSKTWIGLLGISEHFECIGAITITVQHKFIVYHLYSRTASRRVARHWLAPSPALLPNPPGELQPVDIPTSSLAAISLYIPHPQSKLPCLGSC